MKFRAKFYEDKWNGRTLSQGRLVKQKTFNAESWDEAERVEQSLLNDLYEINGRWYQSSLTKMSR